MLITAMKYFSQIVTWEKRKIVHNGFQNRYGTFASIDQRRKKGFKKEIISLKSK